MPRWKHDYFSPDEPPSPDVIRAAAVIFTKKSRAPLPRLVRGQLATGSASTRSQKSRVRQ